MNLSRLKVRPLTLALVVLATIALSEYFLARRNILAFKKAWFVAQEGFINPGLNTIPNLIYRKLLSGYRLRSDHLLGTQRIFSRDEILPERLEANVVLGEEGYFDLIFGTTKESYIGLRLSTHKIFPSLVYEAQHNGKFLRTENLPIALSPGKMRAEFIDGKVLINGDEYPVPVAFRPGKTGVQISFKDAELISFSASGTNKELILNFYPEGNRVSLYLQTFILILALASFSGSIPRLRQESLAAVILGFGVLGWSWQYLRAPEEESIDSTLAEFTLLDRYWRPAHQEPLGLKIEKIRHGRYFPGPYLCRRDGCLTFQENEIPRKLGKRILLFGGSQFRHSLVNSLDESFHFIFDRKVREAIPGVETVNINSTGLFRERLKKYKPILPKLEPDEIIIETLSFDHEVEGIISFIREWQAKGVKVFFLRRAVNPLMLDEKSAGDMIPEIRKGFNSSLGNTGWHIPEVIRVMPKYREAQKEIGFAFLDPNAYFLGDETLVSGDLFWDGFHFTAWGQKLMALWLADEYLRFHQSSK